MGSSRSDGNTFKVLETFRSGTDWPLADLNQLDIGYFDYAFKNADDDFMPLIERFVQEHDGLVLATPIYWYTMSAQLKAFLDRISDLLMQHKDLGRKFRGRSLAVISCGSDEELMEGFEMPFVESARYLGMNYLGMAHAWIEDGKVSAEGLIAMERLKSRMAGL